MSKPRVKTGGNEGPTRAVVPLMFMLTLQSCKAQALDAKARAPKQGCQTYCKYNVFWVVPASVTDVWPTATQTNKPKIQKRTNQKTNVQKQTNQEEDYGM